MHFFAVSQFIISKNHEDLHYHPNLACHHGQEPDLIDPQITMSDRGSTISDKLPVVVVCRCDYKLDVITCLQSQYQTLSLSPC